MDAVHGARCIVPCLTRAFYQTAEDFIQVPPQPAFFEQIDYYRTCFHELGHWTGAKHRLARDHSGRFGSHPYAREELVAEMTSAFACAAMGITIERDWTLTPGSYVGAHKVTEPGIVRGHIDGLGEVEIELT